MNIASKSNIYEICAREGFQGCCSRRIPRIWIQKDGKILKEYKSWNFNIPADLEEINRYFNHDDSILEYKYFSSNMEKDYEETDYNCKISIDLEITILYEFLTKFFEYNEELDCIEDDPYYDTTDIKNSLEYIDSSIHDNELSDEEYELDLESEYYPGYSENDIIETKLNNIRKKLDKIQLKSFVTRVELTNKYLQNLKEFEKKINQLKKDKEKIMDDRRNFIHEFKRSLTLPAGVEQNSN